MEMVGAVIYAIVALLPLWNWRNIINNGENALKAAVYCYTVITISLIVGGVAFLPYSPIMSVLYWAAAVYTTYAAGHEIYTIGYLNGKNEND